MKYLGKWRLIPTIALALSISFVGCSSSAGTSSQVTTPTKDAKEPIVAESSVDEETIKEVAIDNTLTVSKNSIEYNGKNYEIIEVEGGNLSGHRDSNVAVDIGFGDRVYWALTNEYGQLTTVIADTITLQDEENEPVKSTGRYYSDEAKVPGTESPKLDEGHVIADSLGGVSNAYNITPQESTLNRHGDQAYMEKNIRDANGCTNFVANITYPDTTTQIPNHYSFTYTLLGNIINDEFDNINPDEYNASLNTSEVDSIPKSTPPTPNGDFDEIAELKKVDTNNNGKVTIKEAKAAGYKMPISKDDWLYKYMTDRNGDGLVGE